jgi:hypothetical protein
MRIAMMKAVDLSAGVFVRGLASLKALLTKSEAHALAHGIDPGSLLTARLADDMYDLAAQVHWAGEGTKLAVDRLLGIPSTPPRKPRRLRCPLGSGSTPWLSGRRSRGARSGTRAPSSFPTGRDEDILGDRFHRVRDPELLFHLVAVYGILRREGVPLQKADFLGA